MTSEKKFPHYWMCSDCAHKMGGKSTDGVCTVIRGECPYCKKEDTLIPWVDFDWEDKAKDRAAKMGRD